MDLQQVHPSFCLSIFQDVLDNLTIPLQIHLGILGHPHLAKKFRADASQVSVNVALSRLQ